MATNSFSSTIVLELLRNDNYANWCAWMKNYLLAQDLWDIVQATTEPPKLENDVVGFKAWTKNNAAALHAILISCEVDILPEIRKITSAKNVWDKLASMYEPEDSSSIPGDSSPNIPVSLAGAGCIDTLLWYEPLRKAINSGDWHAANCFLSLHEDARSAKISIDGGTILHVAVFAGHRRIVEKLVDLMSAEELEIIDKNGLTALAQAVILQNIGMVDCMLTKSTNLLNISDHSDRIPLITALEYGNIEVARHLYSVFLPYQTLSDIHASSVLNMFILLNIFDLALHLHHRCPASATVPNIYGSTALKALAMKASAFPSGKKLVFWKNWIYACMPIRPTHSTIDEIDIVIDEPYKHKTDQVKISGSVIGLLRWLSSNLLDLLGIKQIYEMKLLHHQVLQLLFQMCSQVKQMNGDDVNEAIFEAVKRGVIEIIVEIVKVDHQLLYTTDEMGKTIFSYAVLHRQSKVFSLICGLDAKNSITHAVDKSGNTILHMAGILECSTARDSIPGEALKMQSELQWFKEVERICLPSIREIRNYDNMTARELFTHSHKNMMKEGEKWMKDAANSCTVLGALIITIMFTAAFTVPGGNDQNTGFPMFSHKKLFTIFIVFDALSLFSSSASILVFLGIITSRYAEEDFSYSLPLKMIIGHYTLFFSIATMMIAFCAGLFIMLPGKSWIVIPIICLASLTVIEFALMLSPFLSPIVQVLFYRRATKDNMRLE